MYLRDGSSGFDIYYYTDMGIYGVDNCTAQKINIRE